MALDEPREGDDILQEQGITFLLEKDLLQQVQPVTVDFVDTPRGGGFKVDSALAKLSACGTSCSC